MAKGAMIAAWCALLAVALTRPPVSKAQAHVPPLGQIYEFGRQNEQSAKQSQTATLRFTPDPA